MTVAIVVKVFDGLVLAADSATTLPLTNGSAQVYNNANKVFHLHRKKPIGLMTWGLGSIGAASISAISKDLRRRFMGLDPVYPDWELQSDYTVEQVANRVVEMFYDELFLTAFTDQADVPSELGLFIAGYSGSNSRDGEGWLIIIESITDRPVPSQEIGADQSGWISFAQPEATNRLFRGIDFGLAHQLRQLVPPAAQPAFDAAIDAADRGPVVPYMPFADAIALAKFMVEMTATYVNFLLGPNTVGGMVEVAGINRHEGFRWIQRKHYYPAELNPLEHGHDL